MKTMTQVRKKELSQEVSQARVNSVFEFNDYRSFLRAELLLRVARNPRYSLRAFSKFLGISPANLSSVLSGSRDFSMDRLSIVSRKLELNRSEAEYFELLVRLRTTRSKSVREEIERKLVAVAPDLKKKALDLAQFQMMGDWKSFAVLASFRKARAVDDPKIEVEAALGLRPFEFEVIRDRLVTLGLLRFSEKTQRLELTEKQVIMDGKNEPLSVLKFHEQWLEWCSRNLRSVLKPRRYSSSEWLSLDEVSFEKGKEILSKALDDLYALSAQSEKMKTKIFGICLHFLQVIPKE